MNSIESKTIFERAKRHLLYNTLPFLVFFLFFVIRLMFLDGFAYDPESGSVFMEANKYLQNFLAMPAVLILFLAGVLLVLYGIVFSWIRTWTKGIWFAGFGTVFTVLALFLIAGYNNTSFYPSVFDLQSSLTIENASSSKYTLTVMSYVTLFIPVVIAYIVWAWRAINRSKIDEAEMEGSTHTY
jgi:cytochrome d ubiquinol oxidase subunit II